MATVVSLVLGFLGWAVYFFPRLNLVQFGSHGMGAIPVIVLAGIVGILGVIFGILGSRKHLTMALLGILANAALAVTVTRTAGVFGP